MIFFSRYIKHVASLLLLVLIAACGGGGSSSNSPAVPNQNTQIGLPTAQITFPSLKSYTEAKTVTVRGEAADNGSVAAVTVNGVTATTQDQYATWAAEISLVEGAQYITVVVEDNEGNKREAAAQVEITASLDLALLNPSSIQLDADNNRILIYDSAYRALLSMDMETGEKQVISDINTPNAQNLFNSPKQMIIDSANNRLFMVNSGARSILSIDLDSGMRTVISSNETSNNPPFFSSPKSIALDMANNRMFVGDRDQVLEVDLSSGERTVISGLGVPDTMNTFLSPLSLIYNQGYILLLDADLKRILKINAMSGERTLVTNDDSFVSPQAMALDRINNRAYVLDAGADAIYSVAIDTGVISFVSDISVLNLEGKDTFVWDIALDAANNRLLVSDPGLDAIISVPLDTGIPLFVWQRPVAQIVEDPERMVLDNENNRLLVTDQSMDAILAIDLHTRERTIISDNDTPNSSRPLSNPFGIALDKGNNRVFVTDYNISTAGDDSAVLSVDLSTGMRTVVADNSNQGAQAFGRILMDIVHDESNNRVFVVDNYQDTIFSIDTDSGERTVLINPQMNSGFVDGLYPEGIVLDSANNRAIVTAWGQGYESVRTVDLSSGVSSVLSDNITPSDQNPFALPSGIALDSEGNRVLVTDWDGGTLFWVDLISGERTVVSDPATYGGANRFLIASGVTLDLDNNRAFVTDTPRGVIMVVDLTDGQRVIWAK